MNASSAPQRILVVRPDTYGDLIAGEPLLRALRELWPEAEVTLFLRDVHADLAPLLPAGVRPLTFPFNAYAGIQRADGSVLQQLGAEIVSRRPDWLIAPCFDRTWLERWVATLLPGARRVGLASPPYPAEFQAHAIDQGHVQWDDAQLFPEQVKVAADLAETAKTAALAAHLLGAAVDEVPRLHLPPERTSAVDRRLGELGLPRGGYIACCPAGVANVAIKAWPAASFGAALRSLEESPGLPALILGHVREEPLLRATAEAAGGRAQVWLGQDGGFAEFVGLLSASAAYLGNDTGAMHAAAACGVPTLAVFGGGTWPRFVPRGPAPTTAVVQPLPCFGCHWNCHFSDAPCLHTIPPAAAVQAFRELLERSDREARVAEVPAAEGLGQRLPDFLRTLLARGSASPEVARLQAELARSEADRAARLRVIEQQGARVVELEAAYHARLLEVEKLRAEPGRSWKRRLQAFFGGGGR